jgi:hypothetical protein
MTRMQHELYLVIRQKLNEMRARQRAGEPA